MKKYLLLVLILCFVLPMYGQSNNKYDSYSIVRSNLGVAGSTNIIKTNKGSYSISQSIGQSSVIGTHFNNGYYLSQGYQQPLNKIKVIKESLGSLNALVFPNPFEQSISISFKENILKEISVTVFDVSGRQVYLKKYSPLPLIELNLNGIANGTYFLKVASGNKLLNAKLIKK